MQNQKLSNDVQLIHARIFRLYMEYCRKKLAWDDDRVDQFLHSLGTSSSRLKEDSSWYTLEFTDSFYEKLKRETKVDNIAFEAGAYVCSKEFGPAIFYLARGLMNVGTLYRLLARFTTYFTRASMWHVVDTRAGEAELYSAPVVFDGDRKYICENRKGILSALPLVFGLRSASVEETECAHEGGKRCFYKVKWNEERRSLPLLLRIIFALAAAGAIHILFRNPILDVSAIVTVSFFPTIISFFTTRVNRTAALLKQNQFLDESLKKLERKTTELHLVSQITNLVLQSNSISELGRSVVENVCVLLNYDRSMFLLVDPAKSILKVEAFYGFDNELTDLLRESEFNVNADNKSGFFIKVVNTGKPVIVENVDAELDRLSIRSRKFAEMLRTKSFVAVPIHDRAGNTVGVLAADYIDSIKQMTLQDQDLLMMLGLNLGFALQTTRILEDLRQTLEKTHVFSQQESRLRTLFQRFIPDAVAQEMTVFTEPTQLTKVARKEDAVVMFFDLANFSSWTENREAEEVIQSINEVYGAVVTHVYAYGGVIDKFLGDGFIAVFRGEMATVRSASAAVSVIKGVETLDLDFSAGIGMALGSVVMGNVGSPERLNFTVMGETVNLASRLQGLSRGFGRNMICVSEAWADAFRREAGVDAQFSILDVGESEVKGYSKKLRLFLLSGKVDGVRILWRPH